MSPPLRVALVVQRYGAEVNGGAEALARRVAGLIADAVDLTVVTTCALDYRTWEDHYPPGEHRVEGVRVLRFPVPEPRDPEAFDALSLRAYAAPGDVDLGRRWLRAQGPVAPGLLDHLADGGYDAVAFVTYLYATTAEAIGLVRDRAVLAPTLHDEPPARLAVFDEVFDAARLLLFSTPEEAEFAGRRFGVAADRARVVGAGLDPPPAARPARFAASAGGRPYALYVGRMDGSKGVPELVAAHARYRRARPDGLDLVLMGGGALDLPSHPWLHRTGFVGEEVKHDALAGAAVVVVPSPYESLSFSQLEAWSHGRPTLANAASPVLAGQSRRSGGGLWYAGDDEYAVMLDLLARARPLAAAIGRQGRRFVRRECSWERVRAAWLDALREAAGAAGEAGLHSAR
ncbi:glycosyltransferase [Miltoncostaea marina]|uniref:glycosyltransferase n=1 Tax=Miltoncostaea marina TaxID=2843215 RepID=UPI001C3DD372|nr:glycosyltransferase [Miltoncostaea marina]